MAVISIDGVNLPNPIKYKPPNFDMDSEDSKRNEEAVLQRDRVREGIFKLELEWKNIISSDLTTIKTAIKPSSIEVTFITEIGPVTKTMYAGNRNIEMVAYRDDYTKIKWNISFTLTEF